MTKNRFAIGATYLKHMSNQYEVLRKDIVSIINEVCVKKSDNNILTAYNWSISRVFSQVETRLFKGVKLPDDLKSIVRFEFNKLKDAVMTTEEWEHVKSRESHVYTLDGVVKRRLDTFERNSLTVAEQIHGCGIIMDDVGNRLVKAKSEEQAFNLRKRLARLNREMDGLRAAQNLMITVSMEAEATPVNA